MTRLTATYDLPTLRRRVVVYVEREDGLLVFEDHDIPRLDGDPSAGVEQDEALIEARDLRGSRRDRASSSMQSRRSWGRTNISTVWVTLPSATSSASWRSMGLPRSWQHVVSGDGDDAALVFDGRFDPAPELAAVQSVFRSVGGLRGRWPRSGRHHRRKIRQWPHSESRLRRRLRLLLRRLNLFSPSRIADTPQSNVSGLPSDAKGGSRRG